MKLLVRFIEAELCPIKSQGGGWIVLQHGWGTAAVYADDMRAKLAQIGLTEGKDFTLLEHGGLSPRILKRVMLFNDELFILAKMTI